MGAEENWRKINNNKDFNKSISEMSLQVSRWNEIESATQYSTNTRMSALKFHNFSLFTVIHSNKSAPDNSHRVKEIKIKSLKKTIRYIWWLFIFQSISNCLYLSAPKTHMRVHIFVHCFYKNNNHRQLQQKCLSELEPKPPQR